MAPKGLCLRLYAEITRDRKIRRMDIKLRWIWIAVMCMAKVSPEPGKLLIAEGIVATDEDIADEAAIDLPDVQAAMQQLKPWSFSESRFGNRGGFFVSILKKVYKLTLWYKKAATSHYD